MDKRGGMNISILLRGKKIFPIHILRTLSGIRLLHIGFQIDECAKSLTGPFRINRNGWAPHYRRSGPPSSPIFFLRKPKKEKKKCSAMFELSDRLLPRLCAQQAKRPQTDGIVCSFFYSHFFLLPANNGTGKKNLQSPNVGPFSQVWFLPEITSY